MKFLRFLEADVRGQRRDLRVGLDLERDRPVGRQRLVPGMPETVGVVGKHPRQSSDAP